MFKFPVTRPLQFWFKLIGHLVFLIATDYPIIVSVRVLLFRSMTRKRKIWDKRAPIGDSYSYLFNYDNLPYYFQHMLKYKQLISYHRDMVTRTSATANYIIDLPTSDIPLVCSHQCSKCGILYECAETKLRQHCKLPFSGFKTKCISCANGY